jgi:integrase
MPRARTGTLLPPGADGFWRARVTKTLPDGTSDRPVYSLGTADKALARRKLAKLVRATDAGKGLDAAAELADAAQSVTEYASAWLQKRVAQGVVSAADERRRLQRHVLPAIGRLPLCDVRSAHLRTILDEMTLQTRERLKAEDPAGVSRTTYSRQSIAHVRATMFRLFAAAWREELIESNPVARVPTPPMREVRKERVILTDDEFRRLIACADVDLELRMASLVARCEGGMRTGDLLSWDWTMIDRLHFAECVVPRCKTGTPQVLAIPALLAPFLRAWWERAGRPESGPVFPSRKGRNAGRFKAKGSSFAGRLRDALFLAGVTRMPCVRVPATHPGTRTDLGKRAAGSKLAPNPADPLYFETATTLPVDFHSFRRAYNTALAEAGVNVQQAMHLAGHSDAKTHLRYVMQTRALGTVPEAALPQLTPPVESSESSRAEPPATSTRSPDPAREAVESSRPVTFAYTAKNNPQRSQRATQESNLRPTAPERAMSL